MGSRLLVELVRGRREALTPAAHVVYRAVAPDQVFDLFDFSSVGLKRGEPWHAIGLAPHGEAALPERASVPLERILGVVRGEPTFGRNGTLAAAAPESFVENPFFVPAVHSVLKRCLLFMKSSDEFREQARQFNGGWFLVRDQRAPAQPNRGPEPEEFFGGILVQDNVMVPASYTPNPFYKVVSPLYGYTRLPRFALKEFDLIFPQEAQ